MTIRIDDVLHFLVARTGAPSTFGAQLDQLRFGTTSTPDPFRSRSQAEDTILEQAKVIRCVDEFAARTEFRSSNAKALERVQRATMLRIPQGVIAQEVLRRYQEWSTFSQERALVAVYQYLGSIAPSIIPTPPKNEPDLAQAFRSGKAKRARDFSAEIYADALLALSAFLTGYNRAQIRIVE